jgi:hypothetical protein
MGKHPMSFLNKKSFHPKNVDNMRNKWLAEELEKAEKKRTAEVQKRIAEELEADKLPKHTATWRQRYDSGSSGKVGALSLSGGFASAHRPAAASVASAEVLASVPATQPTFESVDLTKTYRDRVLDLPISSIASSANVSRHFYMSRAKIEKLRAESDQRTAEKKARREHKEAHREAKKAKKITAR